MWSKSWGTGERLLLSPLKPPSPLPQAFSIAAGTGSAVGAALGQLGYQGQVPMKNHDLSHPLVNRYLSFRPCVITFSLSFWETGPFIICHVSLPPNLDLGVAEIHPPPNTKVAPVCLHREQRRLVLSPDLPSSGWPFLILNLRSDIQPVSSPL